MDLRKIVRLFVVMRNDLEDCGWSFGGGNRGVDEGAVVSSQATIPQSSTSANWNKHSKVLQQCEDDNHGVCVVVVMK